MKASIIIPNYNGEDFLGPCLDSLLNQTRAPDHVIVVDNGSLDRSREIVHKHALSPELIELNKNDVLEVYAKSDTINTKLTPNTLHITLFGVK